MKKFLASLLALSMTASLAAPAFASKSGAIVGDSTVEDVTFTVTVPSTLNFALDPGQTSLGPSQISDTSFSMSNSSEFATLAAFYIDVNTVDGVEIAQDSAMTGYADLTATAKKLSFGVIAAASDNGVADNRAITYNAANPDSIKQVVVTPDNASTVDVDESRNGLDFGIILAGTKVAIDGEITDGTTVTTDNATDLHASFQFFSKMNSYADWNDGDVTVSGVYLLAALNPKTLEVVGDDPGPAVPSKIVTGTTGLVTAATTLPAAPTASTPATPPPVGFGGTAIDGGGTATSSDVYPIVKASATDLKIPFYAGEGVTISSVGVGSAWPATDWSYSEEDAEFTLPGAKIKSMGSTGTVVIKIVADGVTYNLNLSLS